MRLALPDLTMHLRADGPQDAPPLPLLHSLGTDHRDWAHQVEALAGRFRVLRPDLRGHAATDVTPGPCRIDAIPGARLRVLADAAHIPTVERPAAVTDALLDFLDRPRSQETDHV
jgi:pimeloyl-ACP methyl ester carboxylesterase